MHAGFIHTGFAHVSDDPQMRVTHCHDMNVWCVCELISTQRSCIIEIQKQLFTCYAWLNVCICMCESLCMWS